MLDWLEQLVKRKNSQDQESCVLVSTLHTQGSCPRDPGTRMLVTHDQCMGTIGGGHLEYQAIALARKQLNNRSAELTIERFALGAKLGQCCGGAVKLSFETIQPASSHWIAQLASLQQERKAAVLITPRQESGLAPLNKLIVTAEHTQGFWPDTTVQEELVEQARTILINADGYAAQWTNIALFEHVPAAGFSIAVFGAGHVGRALVHTLFALPCNITWIDSRRSEFKNFCADNVTQVVTEYPEDEIDNLPNGCHVVIMTHSHAVDQRVCEASLKRPGLGSCRLIGSATKRRLFEQRLKNRGVSNQALERLICPIGIKGLDGKHPTEIAISVAAQLLQSNQQYQQMNNASEQVAS